VFLPASKSNTLRNFTAESFSLLKPPGKNGEERIPDTLICFSGKVDEVREKGRK